MPWLCITKDTEQIAQAAITYSLDQVKRQLWGVFIGTILAESRRSSVGQQKKGRGGHPNSVPHRVKMGYISASPYPASLKAIAPAEQTTNT
jgi:hypothetical protein